MVIAQDCEWLKININAGRIIWLMRDGRVILTTNLLQWSIQVYCTGNPVLDFSGTLVTYFSPCMHNLLHSFELLWLGQLLWWTLCLRQVNDVLRAPVAGDTVLICREDADLKSHCTWRATIDLQGVWSLTEHIEKVMKWWSAGDQRTRQQRQ